MMGPPVKQPVGGNCMNGPDCESGKCCAGRCIALSTCCNCNTTPRCSNGNVLSATCDAQGTCNERVTDCGGRGCTDGRCHVCQPNAADCSGNTLVTCNASGSATTNQNCQFGCNVARKQCNACQPGVQACNGVRRETCKMDGSGYDPGSCNPMCLRMGECCGDIDCGRCNEIYPCRTCDANNRCQMTNLEPSCNTQGTCLPEAAEVCRMNGATCEVRKRRDSPCKYQLCRWANVSLADCGQGANKGIPTPVCHPFSFNNPESVHWGTDGACATQVENITGNYPTLCLP
jgi:hypothetical protein